MAMTLTDFCVRVLWSHHRAEQSLLTRPALPLHLTCC